MGRRVGGGTGERLNSILQAKQIGKWFLSTWSTSDAMSCEFPSEKSAPLSKQSRECEWFLANICLSYFTFFCDSCCAAADVDAAAYWFQYRFVRVSVDNSDADNQLGMNGLNFSRIRSAFCIAYRKPPSGKPFIVRVLPLERPELFAIQRPTHKHTVKAVNHFYVVNRAVVWYQASFAGPSAKESVEIFVCKFIYVHLIKLFGFAVVSSANTTAARHQMDNISPKYLLSFVLKYYWNSVVCEHESLIWPWRQTVVHSYILYKFQTLFVRLKSCELSYKRTAFACCEIWLFLHLKHT